MQVDDTGGSARSAAGGPRVGAWDLRVSSLRLIRNLSHRGAHALRTTLVRVGYCVSAAVILPYSFWVFAQEWGSFSRIPVTAGILLQCAVTGGLYFATGMRFRLRFSWRKALLLAVAFAVLGLGFVGVLSVVLFSYGCEAVNGRRESRGLARLSVNPNLGAGLVVVLALIVFPWLNDMYFRGTQASMWSPDYNKRNVFYRINVDGFRGPRVPVPRTGTARLLFLGDSSPFGWPYRYEESFPFVVQTALAAQGIEVEVVNAATIGQSIGQIRHQLPYFLDYNPDLVFLMTGVHYLRADQDFKRILKEGVSRDTRWRPFLGFPPILFELVVFSVKSSPILSGLKGKPASASADLRPVNQAALASFEIHLRAVVQRVRDSGAHLYLVDYPTPLANRRVQDAIRQVGQDTGTDYLPLFDLIGNEIKNQLHDDIHPNRAGHRLIAQEVAKVAAEALCRLYPAAPTPAGPGSCGRRTT